MKKQILKIGKALNRAEQKEVFGGAIGNEGGGNPCSFGYDMRSTCLCTNNSQCHSMKCDKSGSAGNVFGVCA